ncbi:MAG: hypothetical protein H6765_01860 [Candidatus Peribacteria bacterium]|nr:MAG: hypothetical protein H6765_01860 [Candidatus Peribacteria bacterium]
MMALLYEVMLGTPDAYCGSNYPYCSVTPTRTLYKAMMDDTIEAAGGINSTLCPAIQTAFNSQGIYSSNYTCAN